MGLRPSIVLFVLGVGFAVLNRESPTSKYDMAAASWASLCLSYSLLALRVRLKL